MTRIIAGRLRGRQLRVPGSGTRPTTDRVREALFSSIQARVDLDGGRVLDLFAGSGALGIEAVSRGADTVWLVEGSTRAASTLERNIVGLADLGVSAVVRKGSLPGFVQSPCPVGGGFDVVFADPPYDVAPGLDSAVLRALLDGDWLAEDALVVWERSKRSPAILWPAEFEVEFERGYGETFVEMGRRRDRVVDTVTT